AAIVEHVLETELLHARMLGLKQRPFPPGDLAAAAEVRGAVESAILGCRDGGQPSSAGRARRPARFVARRIAWHALDHAWEIQDKQEPDDPCGLADRLPRSRPADRDDPRGGEYRKRAIGVELRSR